MSGISIAANPLDVYTFPVKSDRNGNLQPLNTITANASNSVGGDQTINGNLTVQGLADLNARVNVGGDVIIGGRIVNNGGQSDFSGLQYLFNGTLPLIAFGTGSGTNPATLILAPNSVLKMGGPPVNAVSPIQTSGFTVSAMYETWICQPPSSGSMTVTLPGISGTNVGTRYSFKNISTPGGSAGTLILSTSGGVNIDTASSNSQMTNATTTMNCMEIISYTTATPNVYAWAILNKIIG